jgi:hypothetical protein
MGGGSCFSFCPSCTACGADTDGHHAKSLSTSALAVSPGSGMSIRSPLKEIKIEPFPENINRDVFGSWLSGFTDGEGHFGVSKSRTGKNTYFKAVFTICVRADDIEVIRLIQKFWQCGDVVKHDSSTEERPSNPQVSFFSRRIDDLACIISPHFERYPLFAKKRRDFILWKRAVDLYYKVKSRFVKRVTKRDKDTGQIIRVNTNWTEQEKEVLEDIYVSLKKQRKFDQESLVKLPDRNCDTGKFLFEDYR